MIFEECSTLAVSKGRPWDIFEGIRFLNLTFSSVFLVAGGNCFHGRWKNGRSRRNVSIWGKILLFSQNWFSHAAFCHDFTGSTHFAHGLCSIWYQNPTCKACEWLYLTYLILIEQRMRSFFRILQSSSFFMQHLIAQDITILVTSLRHFPNSTSPTKFINFFEAFDSVAEFIV